MIDHLLLGAPTWEAVVRGLNGKRIVVAGGATGIGAAVVRRLAQEGAKVMAGDINEDGLRSTLATVAADGGEARGVRFDLADFRSAQLLVDACLAAFDGIDGLVNVAAVLDHPSVQEDLDLLETPEEFWKLQLDCNFLGYTRTIRAALPHMIARRSGAIVNTSSGAAFMGEPLRSAYAAAKSSINTLTRHVARRWGPDNIRCNSISPGTVLSEIAKQKMSEETIGKMSALVPLGRCGTPDDLAGTYAFLLSDDALWITGQVWSINGGKLMRE
jgi:NAD(P)-dependent dehydrogenase (short-subunit alcohol dehydrogenase family)